MDNVRFILAIVIAISYGLFFWFIAPFHSIWRYLASGIILIIGGIVFFIKKNKNRRNDKSD